MQYGLDLCAMTGSMDLFGCLNPIYFASYVSEGCCEPVSRSEYGAEFVCEERFHALAN
jgi:hypothetical protein